MDYLLDDIRAWIHENISTFRNYLRRLKKKWRRGALSVKLTIAIAALSAWAAVYSYKASQSSADTAKQSQQLSEQLAAAQVLLGRPRIVVVGGEAITISKGKNEQGIDEFAYAVDIRLKNSGERIASPVWVFVQRGTSVDDEPKKIAALPKDTEFIVRFKMHNHGDDIYSHSEATPWLVGTVAGDDIPNFKPIAAKKDQLVHTCQPAEVVILESKENTSNLERPFLLSHGFAVPSTVTDKNTGKSLSIEAMTSALTVRLNSRMNCQ